MKKYRRTKAIKNLADQMSGQETSM
uniref:Uncharacterized protein n=1 Tax=Arundo donax TaxID=35708 RepID=A0A0A9SL59_ARUDO